MIKSHLEPGQCPAYGSFNESQLHSHTVEMFHCFTDVLCTAAILDCKVGAVI